jgi:hypothetical protein
VPKVQTYTLKDGSVRTYPKPKLLDFVTKLPRNFINTNKDFVAKDHAYYLGGAVAATLILLPFDQKLIDNSESWEKDGEWIRITTTTKLEVYLKFQKISDLPLPYRKRFYISLAGNWFRNLWFN